MQTDQIGHGKTPAGVRGQSKERSDDRRPHRRINPSALGRAALAALALAGTLLVALPTAAYCRSTTCSGVCLRDEDGCKTSGHPLYWASLCVGFSLQREGTAHIPFDEVERVVAESFVAWSDLDCGGGTASIMFQQLASVACHKAEYNPDGANANIILFQDNRWDYSGIDNNLAKTTVSYNADTGQILDADIELNHAFNEYTTGDEDVIYDLQSILTHEIGHLLGLDHTLNSFATMFSGYQEGSIEPRTLDDDDIAGLCAIYPPGRPGVCDSTPRGGLGNECSAEPVEDDGCSTATAAPRHRGWLAASAAVLAAALLARRRRRTRHG